MRPPASRPPPEGPAPLGAASELDGAPAVSRREFAGWTALWLWAAVWQSQSTRSVCVPEVFWSFCENKTRPQNLFRFLTPRGLMRNQSESFFLRNRTQKLLRMTGLRQAPSSAERARRTQHAFVFQNRLGPPRPRSLWLPRPAPGKLWAPRDPAAGRPHTPQLSPRVTAELWPGACLSSPSNDGVIKAPQNPVSVTFEQPLSSVPAGRGAQTCGRHGSRHRARRPPDHARHTLSAEVPGGACGNSCQATAGKPASPCTVLTGGGGVCACAVLGSPLAQPPEEPNRSHLEVA